MRLVGLGALVTSLLLCAISGLVLAPSCAPPDVLAGFPRLALGLDFQGGAQLRYELELPGGADAEAAVAQALDVVRERVEHVNAAATVYRRGSDIIVELPGSEADVLERTRSIIGSSTTLELRVVDDLSTVLDAAVDLPAGVTRETEMVADWRDPYGAALATSFLEARGPSARETLTRLVAAIPSGDRQVLLGRYEAYDDALGSPEPAWRTYVVHPEVPVDGSRVADAYLVEDPMNGRPNVMIELDDAGRAAFAQMTTDAVKRRIAIVVDGEVTSAPLVQEPITAGRAQITLGTNQAHEELLREANDLVSMLRAGALPAPIRLADESVIHATYGSSLLLWLPVGALLLLALLVAAGAARYRSATLALAAPLVIVVPGLAALAILSATVTLSMILGTALAALGGLIAGIVVAERVRNARTGARAHAIATAIGPAILVPLAIFGAILFATTSGFPRGFAGALLVVSLAGILPAALFGGGVSALCARPASSEHAPPARA